MSEQDKEALMRGLKMNHSTIALMVYALSLSASNSWACKESLVDKCVKSCLNTSIITGVLDHYDPCRKACKYHPKRIMCADQCFIKTIKGNDPKFSPDACLKECKKK